MAFSISAEFLLGSYQGRDQHGVIERYPSVARLHAALVGAAYARARLVNDGSKPSESRRDLDGGTLDGTDTAALCWLEENQPDAITLPSSILNAGAGARAYREKGLSGSGKASERAVGRAALAGPVVWWWTSEPPPDVVRRIAEFCAEVPYLGEVSTPVRLAARDVAAIDPGASVRDDLAAFNTPGVQTFDVPRRGRAETLQRGYLERAQAKAPTPAQDAAVDRSGSPRTNEDEHPDRWDGSALDRAVAYVAPGSAPAEDEPWTFGLRLEVSRANRATRWPPSAEEHVEWAVATHRAIVQRLGGDAPPLITGRYLPGVPRPANRVSVQVLDAGMELSDELPPSRASILVAVPRDADPDEVDQIVDAIFDLKTISIEGGGAVHIDAIDTPDITRLWKPIDEGSTRWWFPHPLIVADSRPPRRSILGDRKWTVEDAVRVAVGNVFRAIPALQVDAKGDQRLLLLSSEAHEIGVRVGAAHRCFPANPMKYVHHMHPDAVITTVQAMVHLGQISADRAFLALGQSRHLGGGLLVPFDLPALSGSPRPDSQVL